MYLNFLKKTGTLFYHTTNWYGAESIITAGIDFSECRGRQDFGSKTTSYYLNNDFNCATEFGRHRFFDSCAIIVYHIPIDLLKQQFDYLDLSIDHKKWKNVVRVSRNGNKTCEADDYDFVYGPQATNGARLIKEPKATPHPSENKYQLAIKTRKLAKKINSSIIGVIIYK